MHLALACKAVWADYKRQQAAWLEGLELEVGPASTAALAIQHSQLLSLLQSVSHQGQQIAEPPAGAPSQPFGVSHLRLLQKPAVPAGQLWDVATMLSPRLLSLEVVLQPHDSYQSESFAGHFPRLLNLTALAGR